ncbi:hypothetical protein [Bradyrhizobium sp.]|uniref:hypothetical protein n=1 Tax=Bradyrhizobium sp. TaxID=376 RepID=UPI003C4A72FF
MKIEIELSKKEAQEILGKALKSALTGTVADTLEISAVEWSSYGAKVIVTLEPIEEPQE